MIEGKEHSESSTHAATVVPPKAQKTLPLGPFLGAVTSRSVRVWLHFEAAESEITSRTFFVSVSESGTSSAQPQPVPLEVNKDTLWAGVAILKDLKPDTPYDYRLWNDQEMKSGLDLGELPVEDLHFRTLPDDEKIDELDFLLMSCHNPTKCPEDGQDGYAVWNQIPYILGKNSNVRFAILGGDQVYADDWKAKLLNAQTEEERIKYYLEIYRTFWSDLRYRRVLCSLPSFLMWDDHDIIDGWGSEQTSFKSEVETDPGYVQFKDDWWQLFETAKDYFRHFQSVRNSSQDTNEECAGFDFCTRVGPIGFAFLDLRSNRNVRELRMWLPEQFESIKKWIKENQSHLQALFLVTPVVIAHGDPEAERITTKVWPWVLKLAAWLVNKNEVMAKAIRDFEKNIGDIRDDIYDSWGADPNEAELDALLDYLFNLNSGVDGSNPVRVVILSGDIHTGGCSLLYSTDAAHRTGASIPQIISSPVGYSPAPWMLEGYYRHKTTWVPLGSKGRYYAQIGYHMDKRHVCVLSVRQSPTLSLEVKYYLEGFREPMNFFFDLSSGKALDQIPWTPAQPPNQGTSDPKVST